MDKLSYTLDELIEATGVSKNIWFMLNDLNILRPSIIGNKRIWLADDVKHFLEWSRGLTIRNERDLYKEMLNRPFNER